MPESIPVFLRRAFEDSSTYRSTLREIAADFDDVGILPGPWPDAASSGGERRRQTRRYYAGVDWGNDDHCQRVLAAWSVYMHRLTDRRDHEELSKLNDALGRAGFRFTDSGIVRRTAGERAPDNPSQAPLWAPDHFRLFLSHVSAFRVETAALRDELLDYNIAAFVAHDDIIPTAEWQGEIARALMEMDGLTALLTDGFSESRWTSQEVGWALGRGVPVISIRYAVDPFGFMGSRQALSGRGKTPEAVAGELVRVLLRHPGAQVNMGDALAARLARSTSFASSQRFTHLLELAEPLSAKAKEIIVRGFHANSEIQFSSEVPEILSRLIGRDITMATG